MKQTVDVNININHVTRVEGHGNILVNVNNGRIEQCRWQIGEAPRFFESMVRGRHYSEVARITSRICGICSIGHTLASVKATEAALGINISWQNKKLRQLIKHAENFDSHILHVYLLAAPDLLQAKSFYPLLDVQPEVIKRALNLKRIAHEWGSLLAGRTTHPTRIVPGGITQIPSLSELKQLQQTLIEVLPEVDQTLQTIKALKEKVPDFDRPTEYIALADNKTYSLYDGQVQSLYLGEKQQYEVEQYRQITNEYISDWSTAKYCKNKSDSYMVGALARVNINQQYLHPKALQAATELAMNKVLTNPYLNTLAQVIEIVNSVYQSIDILDDLIQSDYAPEPLVSPEYFASGSSAVEVPRGILFHEYSYDDKGLCLDSNFIIPTNQNHANIQKDFEVLVPQLLEQNNNEEEIEMALEMLVRAYDPCISCSTHFLKVKFKK
ncbi:MAG: Ni/Fe hydrogenase subunit alpha [Gammaproteobacteria bacterium]|nr:Ni/Fe hydrogenase subunit alpha [Gammaproteobacteria bacterium]